MSWADKKKDFERRYNALHADIFENSPRHRGGSFIEDMEITKQMVLQGYIARAGLSQDISDNTSIYFLNTIDNQIKQKKDAFLQLNKDIETAILNISKNYDSGSLLKDNGNLQQDIIRLEKEKVEANNDAATANLRDNLLKERDTAITKHQLFFLNRPVKSSAIPFLWGLSILFAAVAIIVFKQLFPNIGVSTEYYSPFSIFMDPRIWMILTIAAVIVIVFLVLKIVGVFDPKNKPKPVE